jgi:preprotein translocase subunit SecA
MVNDVIEGYVYAATAEGYPQEWDLEQLWTALKTLYPISLTLRSSTPTATGCPPSCSIEDLRPTRRRPTTAARPRSASGRTASR